MDETNRVPVTALDPYDIKAYAEGQALVSHGQGELAAERLWREMAATASQLIVMYHRIAKQADAKRARIESWKR